MVSRAPHCKLGPGRRETGALTTELVIAMAILVLAMMPLGYAYVQDQQTCRAYYQRAVAMEIVDGEMEILLAGGWRAYPVGVHVFPATGAAVTNLGPGRFTLTRSNTWVRLEWQPEKSMHGGRVVREAHLPAAGAGNQEAAP